MAILLVKATLPWNSGKVDVQGNTRLKTRSVSFNLNIKNRAQFKI